VATNPLCQPFVLQTEGFGSLVSIKGIGYKYPEILVKTLHIKFANSVSNLDNTAIGKNLGQFSDTIPNAFS
jgi:hypothetical protein